MDTRQYKVRFLVQSVNTNLYSITALLYQNRPFAFVRSKMEAIQEGGCYVKVLSKPYLSEGSKPLIRAFI